MSKPLCWFLQLFGLILIMSGWGVQNYVTLFIGLAMALIGAMGIRERIKADQGRK